MTVASDAQDWAQQGIEHWAQHGVEELTERAEQDRAERGVTDGEPGSTNITGTTDNTGTP